MATSTKNTRPSDSTAILEVALELLAVGLFSVIAGTNNEMGTLVILFMSGLWLIWLINNASVLSGLEAVMGGI